MRKTTAPFKFLDAYQEQDSAVFFGREQETKALYDALGGVKHLLVHGPSGAGKTSLIECGLRNQFSITDWYAITIRRRKDINRTVFEEINKLLDDKVALDAETGLPLDTKIGFGEIVERLFDERYPPIYLLFDQFEELLLLGETEEKNRFFEYLNQLITYRVPCRVLLIMRDEFLGHLSEFESRCPSIFKHRFRLEKMRRSNVQQVIHQMLEASDYQDAFEVETSKILSKNILEKLPDQQKEIELTHVQVYLSELWDRAKKKQKDAPKPILNQALIHADDKLEKILDLFLKKQLQALEASYEKNIPLELLSKMISERHTKLQVTAAELDTILQKQNIQLEAQLPKLLAALETRRVIRPLKKGDETQYEISHDLLASAVGQNLTEEMQLREKAEDVYRIYAERESVLSQDELDFLRPYKQYKPYPSTLRKRIMESIAEIRKSKQAELQAAQEQATREQNLRGKAEANAARARIRTTIASVVAVIALLAAGAAYYYFQDANTKEQEAQTATIKAEENARIAIEKEQEAQDSARVAQEQRAIALEQTGLAEKKQKETERALNDLEQQQKATALAQASEFLEKKQYEDAIKAYQQARNFAQASEQASIQNSIAQTRKIKRQYDYETAREQGLRLAAIQECIAAIKYLETALALQAEKQEDPVLRDALEKCKNN